MDLSGLWSILLVVGGFMFVIFYHELGHFLAARWAGVRCEQFAVCMGQALISFRKGIGIRTIGFNRNGLKWGDTRAEYERRTNEWLYSQGERPRGEGGTFTEYQRATAGKAIGVGETEYRLSWIPIGGYVKLTGQDDLRPRNEVTSDPHSYAAAPVGKRMVIISAGVLMNVMLAGILFIALFMIGFNAPRAVIGSVAPGSPAQLAGLRAGDEILEFDGKNTQDFTKIRLNVALSSPDEPVTLKVRRTNGNVENVTLTPLRPKERTGFLQLGVLPYYELRGLSPRELKVSGGLPGGSWPREWSVVKPGDDVIAVNGKRVDPSKDYSVLVEAIQASGGKPVELTIRNEAGQLRTDTVRPTLVSWMDQNQVEIAGWLPRCAIRGVNDAVPALASLRSGDVIKAIVHSASKDTISNPSVLQLQQHVSSAGDSGAAIHLIVDRDGAEIRANDVSLVATRRGYALPISIAPEESTPIIAGALPDTPAARANLPPGSKIVSVGGKPVSNWFDVLGELQNASAGAAVEVGVQTATGPATASITLSETEIQRLRQARFYHELLLREASYIRRTANPLLATVWGVQETRDLILQGYVTLKRLAQGSVAAENLMGPVGIFQSGTLFAGRGYDWLLWFLAMISANLAVVNFLPIPVVDGGLFVFLLIEKIKGSPVSPKAQVITHYLGLALLLSIFLFVTYNDILRLRFM